MSCSLVLSRSDSRLRKTLLSIERRGGRSIRSSRRAGLVSRVKSENSRGICSNGRTQNPCRFWKRHNTLLLARSRNTTLFFLSTETRNLLLACSCLKFKRLPAPRGRGQPGRPPIEPRAWTLMPARHHTSRSRLEHRRCSVFHFSTGLFETPFVTVQPLSRIHTCSSRCASNATRLVSHGLNKHDSCRWWL